MEGLGDVFLYLALHLSSSFFLSAAHNVLFFVLDLRSPVLHFLHFCSLTAFLVLLSLLGSVPSKRLPVSRYVPSVGLQLLTSLLSSRVHSQNRTGSLYLIRLFDFVTSIVVFQFSERILGKKHQGWPPARLVVWFTISVSLCWLEPGQLEYDTTSLLLAPIVAFSRGLLLLSLYGLHEDLPHVEAVLLPFSLLSSLVLAPFALHSYSQSHVEVTASWEAIDYALMSLCPLFMALCLHSEFWLLFRLGPRLLVVSDSFKWLLASVGQTLLQNFAHPSVFAFSTKIVSLAALARLFAYRPSSSSTSPRLAE